ncbi:carboxypeptidase activation peptide [Cooperia oncophora]
MTLSFVANESAEDEHPFKVFRVVPTTAAQLKRMIALFETAKTDELDFWHAPSVVNNTVDIMVSPSFTDKFVNFLETHNYPFHIAIEDLKKKKALTSMISSERTMTPVHSMGEYYSYSTIVSWMKRIADRMPDIANVIDIGTSTEGRNILGLQVMKTLIMLDFDFQKQELT